METKVLNFLKKNTDGFVSGEDICRKLNVSRTAVWKHINNLRKVGYEIAAQSNLGYKFAKAPDVMLPDEIAYNLKTKLLGKRILAYASIGSTNVAATALAEQGAIEGTVVVAEEQTKGKGRMGRTWSSPRGKGIYASLILRPDVTPTEAGKITLMAAVSIVHTIRRVLGVKAVIKWPNDIFISGDKICGILTEMNAETDRINFIVLGFGININNDKSTLLPNATSLSLQIKKFINRDDFVKELLVDMEKHYEKVKKRKFNCIIEEWRNLSSTLSKRVKVKWRGSIIEGQALDIDDIGALIVRDDAGFNHHILSGDVHNVK